MSGVESSRAEGRAASAAARRAPRSRVYAWAVLAAVLAAGCAPQEGPPIAPFGGRLAAAMPHRDVVGFARFDPRHEWLTSLVGGAWDGVRSAVEWTHAGPIAFVLAAAAAGDVASEGPFVTLFLDPSVHGSFFGFAWRGGSERLRARVEAAGRRAQGEVVELPGLGLIEDFDDLLAGARGAHVLRRSPRVRIEVDGRVIEPAPHDLAPIPVDPRDAPPVLSYRLLERDGLSLLIPARDGLAHVLETVDACGLFAPETGDAPCLRFALGAALRGMKRELRNWLSLMAWSASNAIDWDLPQGDDDQRQDLIWELQWRVQQLAQDAFDVVGDVDDLFVLGGGRRCDVFLRSALDPGEAAERPVWRDLALADLLEGAPPDAQLAAAISVDPEALAERADGWSVGEGRHFGRRGPRRRRPPQPVEATASIESGAEFLDSFSGRAWFALAQAPRAEPGLLERLGIGGARTDGTAADDDAAGGGGLAVRVFAGMHDDRAQEGLLAALLRSQLSTGAMQWVRAAALAVHTVQRVPGGALEVVGSNKGAVLDAEARRRARPAVRLAVPRDAPERACAFFAHVDAGEHGAALPLPPGFAAAMQTANDGLWVTVWSGAP